MNEPNVSALSGETDVIRGFLHHLGLNQDQIEIYLGLHLIGPSTVLALSKAIGSGRTRLYPILENLEEKGLIAIHERHYGTTYEALSAHALEYLVHERESQAQQLRSELSTIQQSLAQLAGPVTRGSKVIEYKGVDGLKQINFNLTKADGKFRVYELAHLDEHSVMPKNFVERLRRNIFEKKLDSFDLTNNPDWQYIDSAINPNHLYQHGCFIDESVFKIQLETYVYNDCIAYLQYDADEIFGVEIYNAALAEQQKQLFDTIWKLGKEFN